MAANDEILGISGHLDITDIDRSINEMINNLDKIGIKTDALSKRVSDAMKEIANSTDDSATKQKRAMEVFAKATEEAKTALANYPEQIRLAKEAMQQTEVATTNLEKELTKLNTQLQGSVIGSDKYNELRASIAGVEQQIHNNTNAYQAQSAVVQQMEEGYNGLVSMLGVANTSTAANAVAHGAVTAATVVEAGAHANNAEKIGEETKATIESKSAKELQSEAAKKVAEAIELECSTYDTLIDRVREGKVENEEYKKSVEDIRNRLAALNEERRKVGEKYDFEADKLNTSDVINGEVVSRGNVELVNQLAQQYNVLEGQIGALQGTLNALEQTWDSVHGKASQGASEVKHQINETEKAEEELNQSTKETSVGFTTQFKTQWNAVNELHDKIQSLKKELKDYEAEYDKLAEKPGFDPQSKKAQELTEKISSLKKEIADTKKEMSEENGVGGFLAKWKNNVVDAATGNGKFQESLGNMKTALGGLAAPFTAATSGAVAFTKALWSMAATPIGAVLSAIVLALQAMFMWFKKDAEGQRAFAKISAYLGSILSSLMDIAIKIGKYLYHAFADPQGALNQFGKGLVGLVINPLKTLAKTLSGFGKIAGGVIEALASRSPKTLAEAWGKMKDGGEDLKKAGSSVIDTLKSGWDTIAGATKGTFKLIGEGIKQGWTADLGAIGADMLGRASKAAQLAEQELNTQKALSEAKVKEKQLEIDIAREREKIYTLTGKEKDTQIELVKNLLKEKYDGQIKAQKELLRITKERNALHTMSLDSYAKEREAQGAVYALEAQRAASTRMLVRMQQANLRSMANASKKDTRQQQQITDAEVRLDDVVYKNTFARQKAEEELEERIADARIAAMQEGTEKVLAEKERAFEKELKQLDEQRKAAIEAERARQKAEFEAREKVVKARGGTPREWSEDEIDKSAIEAINARYAELSRYTESKQQNSVYEEQIRSMHEFLIAYGDFEQQRLAITEEYAKKIQEAEGDPYKQAMLEQQRNKEISNAKFESLKEEMDWEGIFNNLDRYSVDFLDKLRKQLQDLLNDPNITPENAMIVSEKISDVDRMKEQKTENTFNWNNSFLEEQKRLQQEAAVATQIYNDAMGELLAAETDASTKAFQLGNDLSELGLDMNKLDGMGVNLDKVKAGDVDKVIGNLGLDKNSDEAKKLKKQFDDLAKSQANVTAKTKDATKAQNKKEEAEDKSEIPLKDKISKFMQGLNEDAQKYLGDVPALFNKMGFGEIGEKVQAGLDGLNSASDAAAKFASGDYVGAALSAFNAIESFGTMLGIFGESDASLNEDMKKLTSSNERLQKSIDRLSDKMDEQTFEAIGDTYEMQLKALENMISGTQDILVRTLMAHKTGLFSSDDSAAKAIASSLSAEDLKIIIDFIKKNGGSRLAEIMSKYDVGWDAGSPLTGWIAALGGMTPEALAKFREQYQGIWLNILKIGQEEGYKDPSDLFEQLADLANKADELQFNYFEKISRISFDDVESKFKEKLMNMKEDAGDTAEEISKMMAQALIGDMYNSTYLKRLKEWYGNVAQAMQTEDKSIRNAQLQDLKAEYQQMMDEARQEAQLIKDMTGYTEAYNKHEEQSATANSARNVSYEQADAIEGILLNHTILFEQSLDEITIQSDFLESIDNSVRYIGVDVAGINESVQAMVETQVMMNTHLAQISENTSVLPQMRDDLNRVRRLVEEQ